MEFVSITGGGKKVDFKTAVLNGFAEDGGLYVPTELPSFTTKDLGFMKNLSYPELAIEILSHLIPQSQVPKEDLAALVRVSYKTFYSKEVIPHHKLQHNDDLIVQELFHGPTLSFKDVAMGFVVNLFDYFLTRDGESKTLVVATSGDTGPAAAYASVGKESLQTWLLYPRGMISEEQRRQMSCIIEGNIHTVDMAGCSNGSDDLDAIINRLFADKDFVKSVDLSSVNSINWARVMVQTIHYFYGYLKNVDKVGEPVNFSVPAGAFGNLCAGSIAKEMGLPINKFIACSNSNGVLTDVFDEGVLRKKNIVVTYANAIDIAVPMNFWRFLYFRLGQDPLIIYPLHDVYEVKGEVAFSASQHAAIARDFMAVTVSDDEILETISEVYAHENYCLDPHGAVAVAGARMCENKISGQKIICLATAHPAKFPGVIEKALGTIPVAATHQSIEDNKTRAQQLIHMDFAEAESQLPEAIQSLK